MLRDLRLLGGVPYWTMGGIIVVETSLLGLINDENIDCFYESCCKLIKECISELPSEQKNALEYIHA